MTVTGQSVSLQPVLEPDYSRKTSLRCHNSFSRKRRAFLFPSAHWLTKVFVLRALFCSKVLKPQLPFISDSPIHYCNQCITLVIRNGYFYLNGTKKRSRSGFLPLNCLSSCDHFLRRWQPKQTHKLTVYDIRSIPLDFSVLVHKNVLIYKKLAEEIFSYKTLCKTLHELHQELKVPTMKINQTDN